jgi:ATP-dependent RNA helicase RhlB
MLQDRKEERYLILSGCKPPIFRMAQRLEEAGYRVGVITGDTPMRERETIRRSFQAGELDHVVAQVVTVKMGLDFSSLDCILFLNNSNSPDARVQAEDRGQHTQRTTPYMIIDIAVRGFSCARRATALRRHKKLSSMMIKQMNKEVLQRVRKLNSLD